MTSFETALGAAKVRLPWVSALLLAGVFGFVSARVSGPVEKNRERAPAQKLVSGAGLSDESGTQVRFEAQSRAIAIENVDRVAPNGGEAGAEDAAPPSNWLTYARRDGGSYSIYGSDQVGIRFKLSDFDCDTVTIDSVKAYFYCVGAGSPWLDTTVVLRIYDADGDFELWNSGPREVPVSGVGACSLKVALTVPIKTGSNFLVVSDPVAANGTPHVWGDYIQRFRSLDRSAVPGPWSVDSGAPTTYRLMACCSPRTSVPPPNPGARILHETFEGSAWPPTGWALTQSNSSYPWTRVTTSTNPAITGAFLYAYPQPVNPNYYYMIRMYSWFAPSGSWARIATRALSVGVNPAPLTARFQFYQDPGQSSAHDSLYIEVSTTGQTGPWTTVAGFDRQRGIAGWYETDVPLGVYSGNIWVSWRAVSKSGNNLVMDHPMVFYGRGADMGVSRLVSIRTEPRFVGDMDTFRIRVSNFGTVNQTGVYAVLDVDGDRIDSVAVDVNGGTFVDTLLRWMPATGGSRNLRFFTMLPGDQDGSNDTLRRVDYVVTTVTSLNEGFEGPAFPPSSWAVTDSNGVDGTWSRSSMSHHTGLASARTSPDPGPYANGAHDVLYTPVCDLSGAPAWKFSFWHLDSIEASYEHVYLEFAANVLPDAAPPPVWSPLRVWSRPDSVAWFKFDTLLMDGLTNRWRFRWRFTADNTVQRAGTWVDDVKLTPVSADDLGVQSLLSVQSYPLTIGASTRFRIRIRNYGTSSQTAPVKLLADGAVVAQLPAVGPIPALGTFDTALAWTPASTGPVNLKLCTALNPDADPTNDTLELVRYVSPESYTADYAEDFNEAWEDGNNPPWYGWRIVDGGSEYPPVRNRNDWIKYVDSYSAATTEGSGVPGGATEIPNDSLISPRLDCSLPGTYTLRMWYDFRVLAPPDSMRILLSTDDGDNWSAIHAANARDSGVRAFDVTSRVAGEPNVRVAFVHVNTVPNGSAYNYWDIDWFTLTVVPPSPTLALPASGDTVNQTRPVFGWSEPPRAVRYWIQVDDDPGFTAPEVDDSSPTTGSFTPVTPLTEGRWFWRVAASKDVAVWSPFAGPDSFWIDLTPPAIPVLRLPADNVYLGTATPTFIWGAVTFKDRSRGDAVVPGSGADRGPVTYDIEVASDSTFPAPSIVYARTLTDTFVTATALPEARLFWHVRGRDGAGNTSEYCDCRAFEVDVTAPDAPALHAPADESYLNTSGPTFCWGEVRSDRTDDGDAVKPGFRTDGAPVAYRIEVATDSTFPGPSVIFAADLADTTVAATALPNGRLFWHVRAEDGVGHIGEYCARWAFTIMTDPLSAPTLRLPANHGQTQNRSPEFVWNRVSPGSDALVSYRFRVSIESLFVSPLVDTLVADTTCTPPTPLGHATHYWQVMAKDTAGNTSPYSARWDLTVLSPADWSSMPGLPPGGKSKSIKDGGALTYGKEISDANDTGYVYAFKGNNTCEFYRYNTVSNVWISRDSIPKMNRLTKKKAVKKGSALAMGTNGKVYAAKGNNTLDWWCYDPSMSGTWHWAQKADVPAGAKKCKEGVGAAAVKIGSDHYIYLLKGSGTYDFYRYNTATDVWDTSLPTAPGGWKGKPYKNGSSITYDGGDTIYCLKGSYNDFAAYSISGKTWTTKDTLPRVAPPGTKKKKVKDGSGMAYAGNIVYALKGGNTNEFWTYKCDSHRWYVGVELTVGAKRVKGGGALVAARDVNALYAFRGNNTLEFWKYGPISADRYPLSANRELKSIQGNSSFVIRNSSLSVTPNPFTATTLISYTSPRAGSISLRLYDVTGKLVSTLASGCQPAGSHSYLLLAAHHSLAAGIYLLEFENEGCRTTGKLIVE